MRRNERMDCRVASLLAMTVDRYDFTFSRRDAPGVLLETLPSKDRGRREDRVRAAPAVSCAMCIRNAAHEHTGLAEASGLPCAMALRLIRFRPGDRPSCHHHREKRLLLTSLTPAPGRRTQTISPYARTTLVSRSPRVHRISPHVVTIASAPLIAGDGRS
jgi:hypothetical protein